ncbi:MAG: DUF1549 domain-containing protein [Planctomycetota bacterium]|nr:DUF1549 domain-containing protein [Planctomycetota bacterium]
MVIAASMVATLSVFAVAPPTTAAPSTAATLLAQRAASARDSWWSWKPLAPAVPPEVRDEAWVRTPIDRFVLARLEAAGVARAPEASREVLIRRATFDLTGLPPTPEDVRAFVADTRPNAWELLIDRLLASPEYGVKWARHWLDLVRYADTNGFERDSEKTSAWKYRDWVVNAFNDDMPYDRFIVEQLAGDEMPDRDYSSLLATGYYRLGMWDDEVPDLAQAIADDMDSIVDVTARTFLGVGLGCARCHDHKGDPIPQADYYRFAAFFAGVKPYKSSPFNSIDAESVLRMVRTDFGHADPEKEHAAYVAKRASLLTEITAIERGAEAGADAAGRAFVDRAPAEGLVAHLAFEDEKSRTAVNSAPGSTIAAASVRDAGFGAPGRIGKAFSFDAGDDRVDIDRPVQDSFTTSFWFRSTDIGGGSESDRRWFLGKGLVDGEIPGIVHDWGISLVGHGFVSAGTGDPETFVSSGPGNNDGQWHHVAFTRERETGRIALWVDGVLESEAKGSTARLDSPKTIAIGSLHPANSHPFAGTIDEVRFYDRVLTDGEIRAIATGLAQEADAARVLAGHPADEISRWREMRGQLTTLRPPSWEGETVLTVREDPTPHEVHVMTRGNPHSPAALVEPGVPLIAARFEPNSPTERPFGESSGRRLALATWIADGRNALALRTIANRLWQHHFGIGLCPTSNDLGKFGEAPTDPALLDWLATQVPANRGSLKQMHRIMMNSAAYRMSSIPTADALAHDAPNELLSRFRMRRLGAEEIRDAMLASNGTLSSVHGGAGVRPPMPPEVLATSSRPDEVWPMTDESTWTRRTLYIELKRSLQHPLLAVFDQADVDGACPVRFNTVQPTQALSMFNGALTNSLAMDLARRVMRERPESLRLQLSWARELTAGRVPLAQDLDESEAFIAELRERDGLTVEQAMQAYCLVLYNLNDFLTVD